MPRTKEWFLEEPRATQFRWGEGQHLVISFVSAPAIETSSFSHGERVIAKLMAAGLSNAAIARQRGTSVRTVANQVASLLRKAEVESRHQLASRLSTEAH